MGHKDAKTRRAFRLSLLLYPSGMLGNLAEAARFPPRWSRLLSRADTLISHFERLGTSLTRRSKWLNTVRRWREETTPSRFDEVAGLARNEVTRMGLNGKRAQKAHAKKGQPWIMLRSISVEGNPRSASARRT